MAYEEINMRRGSTLYCPKCGKKASTFMRPKDSRSADYRLECKCTSLKCYITFKA